MDLIYREDYWDNAPLKAEFIRFLKDIFNLDLSRWSELGYWDRKYRPFSYFDGPTLAANVCLYSMKMTVEGRRCRVAQISAVGTRPEYRRQGLSRQLTEQAIAWARDSHDFFFLFADKEAFPFYRKGGFRHVAEYKARVAISGQAAVPGAVKLEVDRGENRDRINNLAAARVPVSERLGATNRRLFMFWCLHFLRDCIYYLIDLDLLVLYKRDRDVVTIFDIVGRRIPAFSEIYPYIGEESDRYVEFLFMPDRLNLAEHDLVEVTGNGTHIFGGFPLEGSRFIFPLTAHA